MNLGLRFYSVLLLAACSCVRAGTSEPPIDVWVDVDPGTGVGDVDDGLMLIQVFHSPELRPRGISVVFGNSRLEHGLKVARMITERFGPTDLKIFAGAASAKDLDQETDAVRAMAAELRKGPMTILAVGPVTNLGSLVKRHPELHGRISRIVMVAARRPGQPFLSTEKQKLPHRDANFENDPEAMQAILDTKIPLTFAPWEVSSKVWLTAGDLDELATKSESGRWIKETSQYWLTLWELGMGVRQFNPFDSLAAAWLTHPHLIGSIQVSARIETAIDDRIQAVEASTERTKPYLLVEPNENAGREILYCHTPEETFKRVLMNRLAGVK